MIAVAIVDNQLNPTCINSGSVLSAGLDDNDNCIENAEDNDSFHLSFGDDDDDNCDDDDDDDISH